MIWVHNKYRPVIATLVFALLGCSPPSSSPPTIALSMAPPTGAEPSLGGRLSLREFVAAFGAAPDKTENFANKESILYYSENLDDKSLTYQVKFDSNGMCIGFGYNINYPKLFEVDTNGAIKPGTTSSLLVRPIEVFPTEKSKLVTNFNARCRIGS